MQIFRVVFKGQKKKYVLVESLKEKNNHDNQFCLRSIYIYSVLKTPQTLLLCMYSTVKHSAQKRISPPQSQVAYIHGFVAAQGAWTIHHGMLGVTTLAGG